MEEQAIQAGKNSNERRMTRKDTSTPRQKEDEDHLSLLSLKSRQAQPVVCLGRDIFDITDDSNHSKGIDVVLC